MYVAEQPPYLNAVGEIIASAEPSELLDILHRIEQAFGRDRSREIRMGPRTLDLDILLCGDLVMDSRTLVIPHPRLAERLFVLIPLLELSPDLQDPRTGRRLSDCAKELQASGGSSAEGVYLYHSGDYTDSSNKKP